MGARNFLAGEGIWVECLMGKKKRAGACGKVSITKGNENQVEGVL